MNHATSILLALFGLAAAAPAQVRLEGTLGRHIQVGVQVGADRSHREQVGVVFGDHGGEHGRSRDRRNDRRNDRRDDRRDDGHGRGRGRGDDHGRSSHGHWQTIREEVRVPGYWREECVPAQYGWVRDSCGRRVWGIVVAACTRSVWVPPHCEFRTRQVWVPC
jgi:hypothetical protein